MKKTRSGETGRDAFIIAQALATFIAMQNKLPFGMREPSNARDAQTLLDSIGLRDLMVVLVQPKFDALEPFKRKPDPDKAA